jgi:excisionase family DNA binding protein
MTINEIAELLRLNRKTVYDLARQGKIPVRRVGRSLRASRETVMRRVSEATPPRDGRRTRSDRALRVGA